MKKLTRRQLLKIIGIGAVTSAVKVEGPFSEAVTVKKPVPSCVLSPRQAEGPFYFDVEQVRRDITEDREGTPLELQLTVVDSKTCRPIKDAVVDIWHSDANGIYSGYGTAKGKVFLRGIQITDSEGRVSFKTIYPGWYPGRGAHIHFKVYTDNKSYITSQLYFPNEISKYVYENDPPYKERGRGYFSESGDLVVRWYGGVDNLRMKVQKTSSGYQAKHIIGIKT